MYIIHIELCPFDNVKMENVANKEVDIPTDDQKDMIANFRLLPLIVNILVQNLKSCTIKTI